MARTGIPNDLGFLHDQIGPVPATTDPEVLGACLAVERYAGTTDDPGAVAAELRDALGLPAIAA